MIDLGQVKNIRENVTCSFVLRYQFVDMCVTLDIGDYFRCSYKNIASVLDKYDSYLEYNGEFRSANIDDLVRDINAILCAYKLRPVTLYNKDDKK